MMFLDRDVDEAVRLYVGDKYVQHNPYMPTASVPRRITSRRISSSIRRPSSRSSA